MQTQAAIHFADCTVAGTARVRPNQAFISTSARLPYGTRVTVVLPSADLAVEGIVRWQSAEGVGVQFDRPRARDLRALHRLLRAA